MISKLILVGLRKMDVLRERWACFRYYLLDSRLLMLDGLSMIIACMLGVREKAAEPAFAMLILVRLLTCLS